MYVDLLKHVYFNAQLRELELHVLFRTRVVVIHFRCVYPNAVYTGVHDRNHEPKFARNTRRRCKKTIIHN